MKRLATLLFGGLLAAAWGLSSTYYAIEVKGGSRLYAVDKPVQKGRVLLFHRYPDGVYMSLSAGEVGRIVTLSEAPEPERHAPGETLYIGPPLSGAGASPPVSRGPVGPPPDSEYGDYGYGDYGYYGSGWGGGYVPPPRPPGPVPPSRIGPNGFPIIAPPGSPGSTPLPIGANGFPILAPPPPVPQPRRPQ
ncbi:MAG: hypothetical protein ACM3NW_02975 [Syntrophomonadaceae bacterium]